MAAREEAGPILNGIPSQLPDIDPDETQEWLDSLDGVIEDGGRQRARYVMLKLLERAREMQVGVPSLTATDYINTISPRAGAVVPRRRGGRAPLPRLPALERRGHGAPRAAPRHRRRRPHLHLRLGRDALRGRLQPLLPRARTTPAAATRSSSRATPPPACTPAPTSRAGSARTSSTASARRRATSSTGQPLALPSYPHPRLMPDFWQFPTVSMGIGPMNAIYQAQFNKYLHNRGIKDTSQQHVWAFLGDGEMDEPESRGLLQLAAGEELDNLTFVINCNLQRLDGPVRGNGKIIQELEAFFRGAGWNVIKVVWGRGWDPLLAADRDGALVHLMNTTSDGDYQTFRANDGKYVREHFFGRDPRTREMVEDWSDEDIWWKLKRGGHDYRKVFAAYQAAMQHTGQPTVILAKTIKGYGLGSHFAGRNATHQMKKLTLDDLKGLRDSLKLPISDEVLERDPYQPPYFHPGPDDPSIKYLRERREKLGGAAAGAPGRSTSRSSCPTTRPTTWSRRAPASSRSPRRWRSSGCSRSSCATRSSASASCRSSPTRPAPSAWTRSSRRSRSTTRTGRSTRSVDAELMLAYKEAKDGQILHLGINEAGSMAAFTAAGTSYATHGEPMIPIYVFYSMFGFQRTGDSIWAAADQMTRGFLIGATAGRTTLTGEGLQHADGH